MGIYINKGNEGFQSVRNGEYVDKSGLIAIVNSTLNTEKRFSCVTRCRRFGKTMAAKMLLAYYDRSCDSRSLFTDLEMASHPSFEEHLNKYPVISIDIGYFVSKHKDKTVLDEMNTEIINEVSCVYPNVPVNEGDDLMQYLIRVSLDTGDKFFFIIDEWDAILRECGHIRYDEEQAVADVYVNWLRRLFKSEPATQVFAGVYMTGILPIKKYKTQSALNNFQEYSMVKPGAMARFFGFTKDEVRALADRYGMDFNELETWYDGYQIGAETSMFNPNSVMTAINEQWCDSYWGRTGAYDAVAEYIDMNYGGLKDDIIKLLSGERCVVDPAGFSNDISDVRSRDDVLTVLIHLGYLTYDRREQECFIPNKEVAKEMENAIKANNWKGVVEALKQSRDLLKATLLGDEDFVARGVEAIHDESTSILSYNNENSLACVLSLAYYYARNNYIIHRELATGKGFADLVLIPRKNVDSPAIIIELKNNKDADAAIDQIKRKQYPAKVSQYTDNLLLVGINYDSKTKSHECHIEKYQCGTIELL